MKDIVFIVGVVLMVVGTALKNVHILGIGIIVTFAALRVLP